jgi:hypothetical protein
MKKLAMVMVCVMVLSALTIGSVANATTANPGWYNVIVTYIGALPTYGFYSLTATSSDTSWTGPRIFLIDAANPETKSMLATALTGYANSGGVTLYLPNTIAEYTFVGGVGAGALP